MKISLAQMGSLEEAIGITLHICLPKGTRNTVGEGEKVEREREREYQSLICVVFFAKEKAV